MRITFLGTGAADWKGPLASGEYRRFTSTLFDGRLLIDGTAKIADVMPAPGAVEAMLFTHSHADHFDPEFLQKAAPGRAYADESWASEFGMEGASANRTFCAAGYKITPVPANHSTAREYEQALHYILSDGQRRVLYATDGAWLTNGAYHAVKTGEPLDAAVFDGTVGDDFPDDWRVFEHNTLPMVRVMRSSLVKAGLLKREAPVFVTHLARTLHPDQKTLDARESAREEPLIIAYDGMTAEI